MARNAAFPSAWASAGGSAPSPERTSSGANWRSSRSDSKRQSRAGSTTSAQPVFAGRDPALDGDRPVAVVDRELPALEVEARVAQARGADGALDLRVVQPPAHPAAQRAASSRPARGAKSARSKAGLSNSPSIARPSAAPRGTSARSSRAAAAAGDAEPPRRVGQGERGLVQGDGAVAQRVAGDLAPTSGAATVPRTRNRAPRAPSTRCGSAPSRRAASAERELLDTAARSSRPEGISTVPLTLPRPPGQATAPSVIRTLPAAATSRALPSIPGKAPTAAFDEPHRAGETRAPRVSGELPLESAAAAERELRRRQQPPQVADRAGDAPANPSRGLQDPEPAISSERVAPRRR